MATEIEVDDFYEFIKLAFDCLVNKVPLEDMYYCAWHVWYGIFKWNYHTYCISGSINIDYNLGKLEGWKIHNRSLVLLSGV